MIQVISQRNYSRILFSPLCSLIVMISILALSRTPAAAAAGGFGDALYFSLMPSATLPVAPSSLIINSPTYIDVPAGAKLSVYLMRGDVVVSTSTLTFQNAYYNPQVFVPGQVASFVLPGASGASSGPTLNGAILTAGEADLAKVTMEPNSYRLMWILSGGVMNSPSRAVMNAGMNEYSPIVRRNVSPKPGG